MTQYHKFGDKEQPWSRLRRFKPITKLPGKGRAWLALAIVVVGYFAPLLAQAARLSDASGIVLGGLLCAMGVVIGWRARDSHGRGIAWIAIVAGACFTFAYLIAFRASW